MRAGLASSDAAQLVLDSSRLAGLDRVYFIGPFAERVSFSSQQTRALNLALALLDSGEIKPGDKVAVVGAGLAGVTFAAALLAKSVPVYLFEKEDQELKHQRGASHRIVHPNLNRWPAVRLSPSTAFPFFDWCEGKCSEVTAHIYKEWLTFFQGRVSGWRMNTEVKRFEPIDNKVRLTFGAADETAEFDTVLFATGFGAELVLKKSLAGSYWSLDRIEETLDELSGDIWVSGNGDGGLIECARILHRDFDKGWLILETAQELAAAGVSDRIRKFEQDAVKFYRHPAKLDEHLRGHYEALAGEFPKALSERLRASLRTHIKVRLIAPGAPFAKNVAPIHHLLLAHAMTNDALEYVNGRVEVEDDQPVLLTPDGARTRLDPERGIMRHGASRDLERLLAADQIDDLRDAQRRITDYLFDVPDDAFAGHVIPGYPPCSRTSKLFVDNRSSKVRDYIKDRYGLDTRLDLDGGRLCFFAELVVGRPLPSHLPDEVHGIPLRTVEIFLADACAGPRAAAQADAATALAGETDPNFIARTLATNSSIYREGAQLAGRVGAFVSDGNGKLLALCARHVLEGAGARAPRIFKADNNVQVGAMPRRASVLSPEAGSEAATPIQDAIGWFEVAPTTRLRLLSVGAHDITFAEPIDVLGATVFSGSAVAVEGVVVSIYASVRLCELDGSVRLYSGAMLVRSTGDKPLARRGDSGALINDISGNPIGIVVGAKEDMVVVAPIRPFLERSGFSLPSEQQLRQWNERAYSPGKLPRFEAVAPKGQIANAYTRSALKRAMDIVLSAVFLIFLLPALLAVAFAVKLQSPGPIFYRHRRMGLNGRSISVIKFRTMVVDAAGELERTLAANPELRKEWGDTGKWKRDTRVTVIGAFLRRTSLDELPQLFNVLVGDMSMVGPRAITSPEAKRYADALAIYCSVRPGITGPWQISGRSLAIERRLDIDRDYAMTANLGTDLTILLKTIPAVLQDPAAY